jgi:hypothetical protein
MLRGMHHIVRAITAIRLALAARRNLLLEVLATHHQLAVVARQCSLVEPASVRRTCVCGHFTQDHVPYRTGMRGSTGRSPPPDGRAWPIGAPRAVFVCLTNGRVPPQLVRPSVCGSRNHDRQLQVDSTTSHDRSDVGFRRCVIDSRVGWNIGEAQHPFRSS